MFPIPNLWLIAGLIAALLGGVAWHEHKVSSLKASILAEERQRVAFASELLQKEEAKRAADNISKSEQEASEHEEEMAAKERALEEAGLKIEELERSSKCAVSRATVRKLNSLR